MSELAGHADSALDPAAWLKSAAPSPRPRRDLSVDTVILRGLYPEIALNKRVDRQLWCSSYIATYLERDVKPGRHRDLNRLNGFSSCALRPDIS